MALTQAQKDAATAALLRQIQDGVIAVDSDGVRTQLLDPTKGIDALNALRDLEGGTKAAKLSHFGLRFTKLVPPGCG